MGRRQQHLVPGVHFPSWDFVVATAAAAGGWLDARAELVGVGCGGGGERWTVGVGDAGEMVVSGVLDPSFGGWGRWEDSPVGDQGGVFVIVLVIRLGHLPRAVRRHLDGLLTVFLVQGAGGPAVGQGEGLFGGFEEGQERAVGCGGWGNDWVACGDGWGV